MADFNIRAIFDTSDLRKGARDIKKFNDSLQGGTKETNKDLKKTERQAKKTTKSVGSFFKQLAVGFLAIQGARALINFGQDLRELSAEMQVVNQRAKIVFGESFPRIQKTAVTLGNRIGLTTNEFIGLASSTQDLLVPLGFTRDVATGLTENVTILGAALAEFNNIQGGVAAGIEIVTKALLGEREQLKTLGISILESDVAFRLLRKGQSKLTGETLKQAKALVTLELVTESANDAITKFGESAGNQAVQMARADAAFREAKETLAIKLRPVLELFNKLWLAAGTAVANFVEDLGTIDPKPIVEFLKTATIGIVNFVKTITPVISAIATAAGVVFDFIGNLVTGFKIQLGLGSAANEEIKAGALDTTKFITDLFDSITNSVDENIKVRAQLEANAAAAQLISVQEAEEVLTAIALKGIQNRLKASLQARSKERSVANKDFIQELIRVNKLKVATDQVEADRQERFEANAARQIANVANLAQAGQAALGIIKREVTALIVQSILRNVFIPFPFNIAIAGGAGAIASGLFSQLGFKKGGFVPEYAHGGFVSGFTGNAPESEAAGQVHGGEIVIPRSAVRSMMNGANFDQAVSGASNSDGTLQNIEELLREDRTIIIKNEVRAIDFIDLIEKGTKDKTAIRVQ